MENYKGVEFDKEKDSLSISFVLFKDEFCSNCKDVEYILEEIKNLGAPVYKIDVNKHNDLLDKYSVSETPTVIVFRNGRILSVLAGAAHQKEEYLAYMCYFDPIS